ncbi:dihydroxyacetone kinase phosphoryl donor subunit DhaM [Latilactobacillus graminis]|uniref:phosphoenolpyruvate--glycerone phosphotransferase n=2 Tax=Latilactobacillus graminis TaxID=60519 RepID=A0AA89I309_9LACO|nr:dihydroxyacetone kinase phosphoryl donor subunit DhaM [Latilactobacillus graminis]KRM24504.1 PTS-dependent dihydroxyacetone kinase, phosphotransferase subunit dhaM [Latilactobacillus graminis DSM 20719]QFP79040.1 PTS-dependent dihydroxyacetone kinase phosphotransferase subunit DhaM [Latilactobacillus graminis]
MSDYGVVIVSHVPEIATGVAALINEVATDVSVTTAGGTDEGGVGTSALKIQSAFESNAGQCLLAFYDLGSAKMNLELAQELTNKKVYLYDVALIEGSYTAAALLQVGTDLATIEAQLAPLKIK